MVLFLFLLTKIKEQTQQQSSGLILLIMNKTRLPTNGDAEVVIFGAQRKSCTRCCQLLDTPAWPVRQKNLHPGLAKFQSQYMMQEI